MTHIVKKGETLSKIAKARGITLTQLLDANPQYKANPDIVHVGDELVIPEADGGTTPVVVQPQGAATPFAQQLAAVALELHNKFQFVTEADAKLCAAIKSWTEGIGADFVSCTSPNHPWSAVFVSWCVKQTGATKSEFRFATAHSVFVNKAIKDADNGQGVFHGLPITEHAPRVGDIIQHNRGNKKFSFKFARENAQYKSHSVIVVQVGEDSDGRFALCVGGNESDAVRRSKVRLNPQGFILQRGRDPYICVIKTLK